jgi:hypothetical protein
MARQLVAVWSGLQSQWPTDPCLDLSTEAEDAYHRLIGESALEVRQALNVLANQIRPTAHARSRRDGPVTALVVRVTPSPCQALGRKPSAGRFARAAAVEYGEGHDGEFRGGPRSPFRLLRSQ